MNPTVKLVLVSLLGLAAGVAIKGYLNGRTDSGA